MPRRNRNVPADPRPGAQGDLLDRRAVRRLNAKARHRRSES